MHTLRSSIHSIEKQFEPIKRAHRFRTSHPPASLPTSSASLPSYGTAFIARKQRQSSDATSSDPPKAPVVRKLSPPHSLTTLSKRRSPPTVSSDDKRRRTESSEGLRTPPRVSKPALSIRDYSQIEKERNFDAYKQREKSVMQSLPSLDDLQLPKLPSRNGGRKEKSDGDEEQSHSQDVKESGKQHKQVI